MIVLAVIATKLACVDPAVFGGMPDDGVSDTQAIQQAIDKAIATRADVCLGPGVWNLERGAAIPSLSITGELTLRGDGPRTILRMTGSGRHGDWRAIQVRGPAHDVVIRDLVIDGLAAHDTEEQTHLVEVALGARYVTITNVRLGPMRRPDQKIGDGIGGDCLRLIGNPGSNVSFVKVIESSFIDCDRSGIAVQRHVDHLEVRGVTIAGTGDTPIDFEPTGTEPGGAIEKVSIVDSTLDRPVTAQGDWAITLSGSDVLVASSVLRNGGINAGNVAKLVLDDLLITGRSARISLFRRGDGIDIANSVIAPSRDSKAEPVIRASHNHDFVPHDIRILRNTIYQPAAAPVIQLLSAHHVKIFDNELHYDAKDTRPAFVAAEAILGDVDDLTIKRNTMLGTALGLRLGPGKHAFGSVTFSSNKLPSSRRTLECDGDKTGFPKPITFADNQHTGELACWSSVVEGGTR